MRFEAVAKKAQPLPPRLCPALFPYGAACRLGAVSCRNPRPGGTSGRTWRLQGPREREVFIGWKPVLSDRKGIIFMPLWGKAQAAEVGSSSNETFQEYSLTSFHKLGR